MGEYSTIEIYMVFSNHYYFETSKVQVLLQLVKH